MAIACNQLIAEIAEQLTRPALTLLLPASASEYPNPFASSQGQRMGADIAFTESFFYPQQLLLN